jgi:hypothetical protein
LGALVFLGCAHVLRYGSRLQTDFDDLTAPTLYGKKGRIIKQSNEGYLSKRYLDNVRGLPYPGHCNPHIVRPFFLYVSSSSQLGHTFAKVVFTHRHLSFSAEETTCWVLLEFEQLIMCSGLKSLPWECLEILGEDWELDLKSYSSYLKKCFHQKLL